MSRRHPAGPRGVALPVDGNWRHGTAYAHDKRGCRCDECLPVGRMKREAERRRVGKVTNREAKALIPWNCGERTVLARTCLACGRLLGAEWFNRRGTGASPRALKPTCVRCTNDYKYERLNPEDRVAKQAKRRALESLAADRSGYEWTEADDTILQRTDLTLKEMAEMTRRTRAAVSNRRKKIAADPLPRAERVVPVESWKIGLGRVALT